jgi:hypothetical protein
LDARQKHLVRPVLPQELNLKETLGYDEKNAVVGWICVCLQLGSGGHEEL